MNTEKYLYNDDNVYFIKRENSSYLFYAPTLGILMAVDGDLYKKMRDAFELGVSTFPAFKLMLEKQYAQRLPMDFDVTKLKSKYFHLALGLTENCTLGCVYCHADAGDDRNMSVDLLKAAIDYAVEDTVKKGLKGVNVSFAVGGEPTYNFDLFKKAVSIVRQRCSEVNVSSYISVTTNAFYDEEKAKYVADNIDNILVSLDGLAPIQNLHRPSKFGDETFDKVLAAMDIIFNKKKHLYIRSTVSNISMKNLRAFINFLYNKYGSNVDLVLEPLVPLGRGADLDTSTSIQAPDLDDFGEYFWDACVYGRELNIRVSSSALKRERLASGFCGAMFIPSFTVTTNGIITTCERDKSGENYGYGYYDFDDRKFILDDAAIKRNKALIKLPSKCSDCICLYHCAGDCPDARAIGYNRCKLNRTLLIKELEYEICRKEV